MGIFMLAAGILVSALAPSQTAKNEFVYNNLAEPEYIDPQLATGVPDNNIVVQIFEGLMARKPDWSTLIPGQAESYSVSKDGKTYTFKLRPNLKWSDGSPLTAKDFEYSWIRVLKPETLAQYKYWLTDNIVGADEYSRSPTPENLAKLGIKATDDRTLVVTLKHPVPYFTQLVAESIFMPVKKDVVEKHKDRWTRPEHIVSNGPFKLSEWRIGDRIVMTKNPHYYDAKEVVLDRIVALPIEDRQTSINMFKRGQIDWTGRNGVPNSLVPTFMKDPLFRISPDFSVYFYRFNTTRPPLNDKRVREALTLAIDRKGLTEKVTRGGETPVDFLVAPGTGTYKSPKGLTSGDYEKDVVRARELLKEAGFPGGKGMREIGILYNTDENHKRIAQAIQQMWKKELGVNVRLINQEWKVYLKSQQNMDYDVSRSAWSGDYPDAATFLELFQSSSGNNHTGWKNAEYDALFTKSNGMRPGKERDEVMQKAEEILLNEAPIAPIYFYVNFSFSRPEVVGLEPNLVGRPFGRFISKK